jgi:hypothetical protein
MLRAFRLSPGDQEALTIFFRDDCAHNYATKPKFRGLAYLCAGTTSAAPALVVAKLGAAPWESSDTSIRTDAHLGKKVGQPQWC